MGGVRTEKGKNIAGEKAKMRFYRENSCVFTAFRCEQTVSQADISQFAVCPYYYPYNGNLCDVQFLL